jgi:hypothetical protein
VECEEEWPGSGFCLALFHQGLGWCLLDLRSTGAEYLAVHSLAMALVLELAAAYEALYEI